MEIRVDSVLLCVLRASALAFSLPRFRLTKRSRDGLDECGFLGGENGAEVEDERVGFDASDHADAGGGAAEPLLKLRGGVAIARDVDQFGRQ